MARPVAPWRRRGTLLAAVLLISGARAHIGLVCTATHELRPQTATFLVGTYHAVSGAAAGSLNIKSPQGTTYTSSFTSYCSIAAGWDFYTDMATYRAKLLPTCVCSHVLKCGTYNAATKMCTTTTGDCPKLDPAKVRIDCYGQERDVPSSVGQVWGRIKGGTEKGNCAYGSPTADANSKDVRT